jgi:hypothetical protein
MSQLVKIFTLVDITDTGVSRVRDSNKQEYHQQQNLNVLLQTIGLRTQAIEPHVKIFYEADLRGRFSELFPKTSTVWCLSFRLETESVWRGGSDELSLIKKDLHGIAISGDLDNTVDFVVNIFDTRDNINTYFVIY